MEKSSKTEFDLHAFLANANGGRAISAYRANQPVFAQGEPADSVFYVQEGK
jgi:CRP/FNR family transcriptional regulator, cyclic AMP receptor protein